MDDARAAAHSQTKWTEARVLAATFVVAVVGSCVGVFFAPGLLRMDMPPRAMAVDPVLVAGSEGLTTGTYTLVEFMDYQCPPCRKNREKIEAIVALYRGKLRLVIRHLPLPMHHTAASSAAAAEAARDQGKFWEMHAALLSGGALQPVEIRSIARKLNLNEARFMRSWTVLSKSRVQADMRAADALGIEATPTFLLCTPNGKVWRLDGLSQVHDFIR